MLEMRQLYYRTETMLSITLYPCSFRIPLSQEVRSNLERSSYSLIGFIKKKVETQREISPLDRYDRKQLAHAKNDLIQFTTTKYPMRK